MSTLNIIMLIIVVILFLVGCSKDKMIRYWAFSALGAFVLIIFAVWTIQYWIKYVTL